MKALNPFRTLGFLASFLLFPIFNVCAIAPPTISSFTPVSGAVGTTVTITGTNFNTTMANDIVFFGATKATVSGATATSLTVIVPLGASYQNISVTDITSGLTAYSSKSFITTFVGSNNFDSNSFEPKMDITTVVNPHMVIVSDLNNDGKPDLIVVSSAYSNVSVFINTSTSGTISFDPKVDFTVGTMPVSVSFGDVDGDGKPDLVATNASSNSISILRNTTTGSTISFAPKIDYSTGATPYSVSIGDFDSDGKPDLTVANYGSTTLSIFRNTCTIGTISFVAGTNCTAGTSPFSVSNCDLDGDGKPDLAVSNSGSNAVSVFKNTSTVGSISFATKVDLTTGTTPRGLRISDLNNDGKPDLAVVNAGTNNVSIFGNTCTSGSISFTTKSDFTTGAAPYNLTISDIDGDGKPDIATNDDDGNAFSILKNTTSSSTFTFSAKVDYNTGTRALDITIVDLNGDEKPDVMVANFSSNTVSVFKSQVAPPPTIISFSPSSATSGATVTITGTNFIGCNAVSFGGTPAFSYSVVSATSITAIINTGTSGSVSVNVPGGGLASKTGFVYTLPSPPTITSFSPTSASTGTIVTITGTNLIGTTAVTFGGAVAESFAVTSSTSMTAIVGSGASGNLIVTTPGGSISSAGFTFIPPPIISSFSPAFGAVGSTVTITGANFNTTPTNNIVFFGATKATVNTATSTSLTVTVPLGATYQNISVSDIAKGLTAYSVKPFITTFAGSNAFDSYSFADKLDFTSGTYSSIVSISDLDGDGKSDIVVVNTGTGDNTVSVLLNTSTVGNVSFTPKFDFIVGTKPISIAIGDLDGDGKPDLIVANYNSNTVSVLRNSSNIGTVSFASKVDYGTGTFPYWVSVGDFNNDGKPDIAIANNGSNSVSILRNTCSSGTISFAPKVDFTTGNAPISLSIGDLDGDGSPDLAVSNNASSTISVLRCTSTNGTISFAPKIDYTTGTNPYNQAIGDLDGDGKPDLAVVNYNSNTISILRNTSISGTISFVAKVDYTTGTNPTIISINDLDGDGKADLALVNYGSSSISVFRNVSTSGTILFSPKVDYPTGAYPRSISIGDIDGDGKPDMEVAMYSTSNMISVLKSTVLPVPTITSFTPLSATSGATVTIIGTNLTGCNAVSFGGTPAFSFAVVSPTSVTGVIGSGVTGNVGVTVAGRGTASLAGFIYTAPPAPTITSFAPTMAISGTTVTITGSNLIGTTAVSFGGTAASFTVISATSITAVVGSGTSGNVSITTPGGTISQSGFVFTPPPSITSFSPTSGAVGTTITITGTGFNTTPANNIVFFGATKATVSAATATTLTVIVPLGTTYQNISVSDITTGLTAYSTKPFITTFSGSNAFDSFSFNKADINTGAGPHSVSVNDVDGDGKPDMVIVNYYSSSISVFRNTSTIGTVSFATSIDFTTGSNPYYIAISDLNGDGKPDIAVVNSGSNTISILKNTCTSGTISFAPKSDITVGSYPYCISIGDLDGDGKPDLAVANSNSSNFSVIRNTSVNSTISFAPKTDYSIVGSPEGIIINDFDGDGKPDLAVTNLNSYVSVYRNTSVSGTISLATKVDLTTGSGALSIASGDLDGDGKPDLVMTNSYSYTISVLRNTSSTGVVSFATKVDYVTGDSPYGLFISDLDGDGKPDLAVGNNNSNTVSIFKNTCTIGSISFVSKVDYAVGSGPFGLWICDMDGDEKPDIMVPNTYSYNVSVFRNTMLPGPSITSFTPSSATSGATVTITGTNFTGCSAVSFGGTSAFSFNVVSPTSITAVVGSGVTGSIKVTVAGGGTATLAGFTYTTPPPPTITSFTPTNAITGAAVTITGTNLIGTTAVNFGGTSVTSFTVLSATGITAIVGGGASGNVNVTTPGGTISQSGFTFIPPPTITSFTPVSGTVGTTVTITGTGFNATPTNNIVSFGATKATVSAASATSLTVVVPLGATFQNISVSDITTGLTAYSTKPFITTFSGSNAFDQYSFGFKVDFSTGYSPYISAIADLDGDGKPDLAVANSSSSSVSLLLNTSAGGTISFNPKSDLSVGSNPYNVALRDLNGDGKPDLVATNYNSNTVSVFLNTSASGIISFGTKADYVTGISPWGISIGDVDGDGKPDLIIVNRGSNSVSILRNTGVGGAISFGPKMDFATGSDPRIVAINDLDGDGKPELSITNYGSNTVSVLRNTSVSGTISFAPKADFTAGSGPAGVAIGDLDGDGKPDMAVTNYGSNSISVFRNTSTIGTVSFATKSDFTTGSGANIISMGDLNGDGKLDLAIANASSSTVSVLCNTSISGTISFVNKVDYATGTNPNCILIVDIDGDEKPDLVATNQAFNNVSVLKNVVLTSPIIASFTPTSATSGNTVTITGTNFTGCNAVSFGGIAAFTYNVVSPTSITAVVNTGNSGSISITVPAGGTATLSGFTYTLPPAPTITSFTPSSAISGSTITITGTNLIGTMGVSFGGTAAASYTIVSATSITAVVGTGTSGSVSVTTPGGTDSKVGFTLLLNQAITFGALSASTYGDSDFDLTATASSSLPVSFSSSDTTVGNIVLNKVHIIGAGTCYIKANQEGNSVYGPAPQVSKLLTVNAKAITATGIVASNKVYDGTTIATFNGGILNGVIGSDVVTLVAGNGVFANKNLGNSKAVTSTGFTLGGANASNYVLSAQPSGLTANITAAQLSITGVKVNDKIYNGNKTATLSGGTLSGVLGSDVVTIIAGTGTFSDKNAGNNKTVTAIGYTLGGAGAGNYTLSAQPSELTANITAAQLTISGVSTSNRTYNGTNIAVLTGGRLNGIISPDVVTISPGSGTFADKNVGTSKSITISGYSLAGTDASNYTLQAQPSGLQANVSTTSLIITAKSVSRYQGEPNPVLTATYSGFVNGETEADLDVKPQLSTLAGISSSPANYDIVVSGAVDNNYSITYVKGTLTIMKGTLINYVTNDGYSVYPNPANDYLIIKSPTVKPLIAKIFDMSGRLMLECNVINDKIDLQSLAPGVYNLKIDGRNFELIKR